MHICILHIGFSQTPKFGDHLSSPERFMNLLSPFLPLAKWTTISAIKEVLPENVSKFDAYIITGGKYSVFEDYDWQFKLFNFIGDVYLKNIPLIGICYGHQLLAHVLGGKVRRSENGWGIGVVELNIETNHSPKWLNPRKEKFNILSMHQDQVEELPKGATNFLTSKFCPYSAYYIPRKVLAFQQHPEFTPELCRDLILKRKEKIGMGYKVALETLKKKTDGKILGQWMAEFLKVHC